MRFFLFFILFIFSYANNFLSYKEKFIVNNSKVIDPYNNNRITSEAEGYAMILAVKNNNKKLFDSLWMWTEFNLQREDNLFSWEYNYNKILDKNNATDGDLLIAYALIRAYEKWGNKKYLSNALKIVKSIKKLIIPICSKEKDIILTPAKVGFIHNNLITIFPSYYIPFIFKKIYFYDRDIIWREIYKFSYKLFQTKNISTNLNFDLFNKKFNILSLVNLDVYRIIPYTFIDNKNKLKLLKKSFEEIDRFFEKNGFIPLNYYYDKKSYEGFSPYCVYKWFYLLYGNKNYLKKYYELKKLDKKNYFCESLDLLIKD